MPEALVTQHLTRLPDDYFDTFDTPRIEAHLRALDKLSPENPVEFEYEVGAGGGVSCTIFAFDCRAAFAMITGILAGSGMSIESGQSFTYGPSTPAARGSGRRRGRSARSRDTLLYRRRIVDAFEGRLDRGSISPAAWGEAATHSLHDVFGLLEKRDAASVAQAKHRVDDLVGERLEQMRFAAERSMFPVSIDIDNSMPTSTHLHVVGEDTPFFLYSLSNALALRQYSIEKVEIATHDTQVEDDLFVVDSGGRKIEAEDRLNQLRLAVLLTKQFTYFLGNAPNPHAALARFELMVDDLLAVPESGRWQEMLSDPRILEELARLLGISDYLWEDFIRGQYEVLLPMLEPGLRRRRIAPDPDEMRTMLSREIGEADTIDLAAERLNAFKDRYTFLIDVDHILNPDFDFRKLSARLTELAELVVHTAADLAFRKLEKRYGSPRTVANLPARFACLGLGKLGGAALGYASDIELLVVYDDNGETAGPEIIQNAEFFNRLVMELRQFIRTKRHGIFNVDLQLRPYGSDGPLAASLTSFCEYYGPGGAAHSYERLALVRLRRVAGDRELGERIERLRDEMIYRTDCLDLAELRELRHKKKKKKIAPGRINAKFSPGGLVDIEYDIQILQVMYGNDRPALRTPRIHEALEELSRAGIIRHEESRQLREAYKFLRRLINGLRMLRGSAKDLFLPEVGDDEYAHLARRIGYRQSQGLSAAQQLRLDFETWTATVRAFVERHFGRESLPGRPVGNMADLVLSPGLPPETRDQTLKACGFTNARRAFTNLQALAQDGVFAQELARLAGLMRDFLSRNPDPDMALNNWERFADALRDRREHYELLLSQPRRLELLLSIFGTSQFLSDTLSRNPGFFEKAIHPELLHRTRTTDEFKRELDGVPASNTMYDLWLDALRRYRRREILRIAVRDICLQTPIEEIVLELSNLAEAVLDVALRRIWQGLARDEKRDDEMTDASNRFCVLAFGKLGGRELNYSSDIDLVGIVQMPDGNTAPQPADLQDTCFARAMEQLRAALSEHTPEGYAYRVDLRLRPYGSAGAIVCSVPALTEYYHTDARFWEIQALLKARPVAGNHEVGERFLKTVREILCKPREAHDVCAAIADMRRAGHHARGSAQRLQRDIKNGPGGIRDIEFTAQACQLIHAAGHSELLDGNTLDALRKLREAGVLDNALAHNLEDDYRFLRKVEHHLQIDEDRQTHSLPTSEEAFAALARRILGHNAEGKDLSDRIRDIHQRVLSTTERTLGKSTERQMRISTHQ